MTPDGYAESAEEFDAIAATSPYGSGWEVQREWENRMLADLEKDQRLRDVTDKHVR